MANVVQPHPQIDFHASPLGHPPQIGLGLSLSMPSSLVGWSLSSPSSQLQSSRPSSTANQPPLRTLKRRFEQDEEQADQLSGHGPGAQHPERPKRATPKQGRSTKESHNPGLGNQDVDVGVLLETALQALTQSAKRLRDAYPYSNHPPSQISLTTALGFGFGSSHPSKPTSCSSSSSLGFGSHVPQSSFGVSSFAISDSTSGMREEYVVSRLRPHVNDFVSSFQSYLPYFSQRASNTNPQSSETSQPPRRDRCPPTETFFFLQSLTSHILAQPPLTQATLVPLILSRLLEEWKAWAEHVDDVVNRHAGMFGEETVRGWERVLDEFADAKGNGLEALREVRDSWIAKVGWLVGRVGHTMMED
ncbi:hypothetical protein EDB89DRAFT_1947081 [Lactarius sanguifluus]|nr:hypothetical protein EDB89DRAFT_1947081 [Lactarius sanguifluus]